MTMEDAQFVEATFALDRHVLTAAARGAAAAWSRLWPGNLLRADCEETYD